MVNVLKIPNYESIDSIFESYYNADRLVEEKIRNNLETLYARKDLPKEERETLVLKCGDELEFVCYVELGYFNETNEYFFNAESIGADFNEEEYHSNLEDLVKVINKILSKTYNTLYGAKMNPLFYTVADHEKEQHDYQTELEQNIKEMPEGEEKAKAIHLFGILFEDNTFSRGLTDEEIEKFQNLYKRDKN